MFYLKKQYDDTYALKFDYEPTIASLRSMPSFILQLIEIKNSLCEIIYDKDYDEETATVELDY